MLNHEQPPREAFSLDAPLDPAGTGDGNGLTLQDVIGDHDFNEVDFELDIGAVLGRLTGRQQELIRGRLRGEEMKAISERLGVHRDTLYQDRKQIRATFRDEGLLEPDPTDRLSRSQRGAGGLS